MADNQSLTLLVFENDWCAQCYTQRPIIKQISQYFYDQLKVQMVNVENDLALADQY